MQATRLRTVYASSLLLVAFFLLTACGKGNPQNRQMPPAEVGVQVATPRSVPLVRQLVGRLSAYRSADVRARVSGVLLSRDYKEGSLVKKGQVLFRIDPAPLKAVLDSAKATLAQARADYTNKHIAARRARNLAPKGFVSQSDLDNAEAAERTAAAAVQQAQAQVESAKINLGYATVRSPIDGRAGQQQVTEGALVGQGSATLLTTVDQIDPLYVNFTMAYDELDRLRREQVQGSATLLGPNQARIDLSLPDGSTYDKRGTLDFSGTTVDPDTGAVNLRGRIPNPENVLLPGMYVHLKVDFGALDKAFLVPESALMRDATGPYLLLLGKGDKVEMRRVGTSGVYQENWIVTQGLHKGDRIIVSGLARARPGQPARIASAPNKPAAAKPAGAASRAAGSH